MTPLLLTADWLPGQFGGDRDLDGDDGLAAAGAYGLQPADCHFAPLVRAGGHAFALLRYFDGVVAGIALGKRTSELHLESGYQVFSLGRGNSALAELPPHLIDGVGAFAPLIELHRLIEPDHLSLSLTLP